MKSLIVGSLFAVVFLPRLLPASETEYLEWSEGEIRIVANERKDAGKVVFTAKRAKNKYREVQIEAFGQKYALNKEQLEELNGFSPHSLNLKTTYEGGRGSGIVVYFEMRHDRQTVLISVNAQQGLIVTRTPVPGKK
jgi:hypothetical protein